MIGLFVSAEDLAAVAPTGVQFLQIVSPFYFVVALKLVVDGSFCAAPVPWFFL